MRGVQASVNPRAKERADCRRRAHKVAEYEHLPAGSFEQLDASLQDSPQNLRQFSRVPLLSRFVLCEVGHVAERGPDVFASDLFRPFSEGHAGTRRTWK